MSSKKDIRTHMINKRLNTELEELSIKSQNIREQLELNTKYKKAHTFFIYVSYNKEVDTIEIIKNLLREGKIVTVPKVISRADGMVAVEIKSIEDLTLGYKGILEPKVNDNIVNPLDIDLAIIPGVAFDKNGGRVGYGGGFYDRYLLKLKEEVNIIALAYDFQVLDSVPVEDNDFHINEVIYNK